MALHWTQIYVVFLVISPVLLQGFFISSPGKVTPVNPLVELGNYIELNCTLTGDVAPFNSSHLYFQAGSKVISSEFYAILSPTIMTYKENMTGQYTGRHPFYCYLNQSTSEENVKPRLIGSQVATIGRKPVKPTNFRARFNNWNDGHVSWEPEQKNATFLHTATNVSYSFLYRGKLHQCGGTESMCSCTENYCYFSRIVASQQILYLFLTIKNALGELPQHHHQIVMKDHMVPYAVNKVKLIVDSSVAINVTWEPNGDKPISPIMYRVLYKRDDKHQWQNAGETDRTWFLVEGLHPYQNYTFDVTVKVASRNSSDPEAWSDSKQDKARTKQDIPARGPGVHGGGFEIRNLNQTDSTRTVVLYWEDIPQEDKNGILIDCRVRDVPEDGPTISYNAATLCVVPADRNMCSTTLKQDRAYRLVVECRTEVGYSSNSQNFIEVPSVEKVFPVHQLVAFSNVNNITVRFNIGQSEKATIVYCPRVAFNDKVCNEKIPIVSQVLENGETSHMMSLEGATNNLYGVSVFNGKIHSGINWADCLYDYSIPRVEAPKGVVAINDSAVSESLTVSWEPYLCSEMKSPVLGWTIFYYPHNDISNVKVHNVTGANKLRVTIPGVPEGQYCVEMSSYSEGGHQSYSSKCVIATSRFIGLRSWEWGLIATAIVIALILAGIGLRAFVKRCRKGIDWCQRSAIQKITVPDDHDNFMVENGKNDNTTHFGGSGRQPLDGYTAIDNPESPTNSGTPFIRENSGQSNNIVLPMDHLVKRQASDDSGIGENGGTHLNNGFSHSLNTVPEANGTVSGISYGTESGSSMTSSASPTQVPRDNYVMKDEGKAHRSNYIPPGVGNEPGPNKEIQLSSNLSGTPSSEQSSQPIKSYTKFGKGNSGNSSGTSGSGIQSSPGTSAGSSGNPRELVIEPSPNVPTTISATSI